MLRGGGAQVNDEHVSSLGPTAGKSPPGVQSPRSAAGAFLRSASGSSPDQPFASVASAFAAPPPITARSTRAPAPKRIHSSTGRHARDALESSAAGGVADVGGAEIHLDRHDVYALAAARAAKADRAAAAAARQAGSFGRGGKSGSFGAPPRRLLAVADKS